MTSSAIPGMHTIRATIEKEVEKHEAMVKSMLAVVLKRELSTAILQDTVDTMVQQTVRDWVRTEINQALGVK